MASAIWTGPAFEDIGGLCDYIALDNPVAAEQMAERLTKQAGALAEHPMQGKAVPWKESGLRMWPIGNYIIFYRPIGQGIEVVRVLHGARDYMTILREE